ncbi:hypothetical protein N6L24_06085 [Cognatishimia sp. SS12]|uniref:hypothetical protein n=1 Tax=Cognatishimia sp. SS12 TaxID=2979465 RepID=UPI00232B5985|nr:hypothetical protein [Cognatishimia sp. SS12]MDC0737838.1 hypothetical protein [Cognatishimia sp. SS12]
MRQDTQDSHKILDAQITQLCQEGAAGYRRFIVTQWQLFSALSQVSGAKTQPVSMELAARALADLRVMKINADERPLPFAPHPLAVDYLVAGSRLGNQILRRMWRDAGVTSQSTADAYLSAPDYLEHWRGFLAAAETMPPEPEVVLNIVENAIQLFNFCADLLNAQSTEEGLECRIITPQDLSPSTT